MATRIRLLVAVPGTGGSGDIIEMPAEEAAAWVAVGRAELLSPSGSRQPRVETATSERREVAISRPSPARR